MYHLIPFMEVLAESEDVREKNQEAFKLNEMAEQNLEEIEKLFAEG